MKTMNLNQRAWDLCQAAAAAAGDLRIAVAQQPPDGPLLLDFGIEAPGGLEAGRRLAEICLAGLGRVDFVPGDLSLWPGPAVCVSTDHPVAACMAAQYAGWEIAGDEFFAMGSGPMRCAAAQEELFGHIGHQEKPPHAVGVLESGRLPPQDVCRLLAESCGVSPHNLALAVAPTSSLAGTIQVVARTVETAMHKLHELGYDLARVQTGCGVAPLPPVAADDLAGIGRTNDAILYGGQVTLWVRDDDAALETIGPRIPSSASSDHGRPFAQIFAAYDHDFYQVDRLLFSPAVICLVNLNSGRVFRFGRLEPAVLQQSFHGQ